MNFIKSVSLTLGIKIVNLGITTLFTIILARYLGPQGIGFWSLAMIVASLALQLTNFAIDGFNIYYCAKSRDNLREVAPNSFWFGLVVGLLTAGAVFGLIEHFPRLIGDAPVIFITIALAAIPFSLIFMFFHAIFLGINQITVYNWFEFINQFLLLTFGVILLIFLKKGILELLIARTLIIMLLSSVMVLTVYKLQKFSFVPSKPAFREMINYGLLSHPCRLLAFLTLKSDVLLVNYFLGAGSTGIYSLAVNFGDTLLILPGIIGLMLFPRLSADPSRESALNTAKVARLTTVIMLAACLGLAVVYRPLVKFIFGAAFLPSVPPMLVLLPGIFFLSVETIFAQYLASRVQLSALLTYWIAAFLANFGLNLILLPKVGVIGASLSSSLCYLLVGILIWRYFRKTTGVGARESFLFKPQDFKEIEAQLLPALSAAPRDPAD